MDDGQIEGPRRFETPTWSWFRRFRQIWGKPLTQKGRKMRWLMQQSTGSFPGSSFYSMCLVLVIGSFWTAQDAPAQYIKLDTPLQSNTESFYERFSVDFGFSLPSNPNAGGSRVVGLNPDGSFTQNGNVQFTQGGSGSAVPPFGGYDPSLDGTFGYGVLSNGGGYQLGLRAGQGNTRTSTVQNPTIVVPNGVPGSISDTIQRPFVTGIIPVVGGLPPGTFERMFAPGPPISPLDIALHNMQQDLASGRAMRDENGRIFYPGDEQDNRGTSQVSHVAPLDSSANYGDLSVAEIRRRRELAQDSDFNEHQDKIDEAIALAESSLEKGKTGAARIFLRRALRMATGAQKEELQQRIDSLNQLSNDR